MVKKSIVIISLLILLLVGYYIIFEYGNEKNDYFEEIEQEVLSLKLNSSRVAHIEYINDDYALAIFEWGISHAGIAELEKHRGDWHLVASASDRYSHTPYFVQLSHFSVIYGLSSGGAEEGYVELQDGSKHAISIEGGEWTPAFWFYYSEDEDLSNAKVTSKDEDGEIIFELDIDDKPNEGLERQID
jgi:hypothetical protein